MKPHLAFLSWLCLGPLPLAAQTPPAPVTLVGLVNVPDYQRAVLSVTNSRPFVPPTELLLGAGERSGDIEVLRIHPEPGAAELRLWTTNFVATLPGAARDIPPGRRALALAGVYLPTVLTVYAELSGRTLLRNPALPNQSLTLEGLADTKADAAKLLADALMTNGVAVIADGEKFAFVVPKAYVPFVQPHSAEIPRTAQGASASDLIPAGGIMLMGADLMTVAMTYAELRGRKTNPATWSRDLPPPNFFFRNQTALTKAELIYAYEKLFELHGLKMVPEGDEFMKPEPLRRK